jgi:hypothetical protein
MQDIKIKIDQNSFLKLSKKLDKIKLTLQVESGGKIFISSTLLDGDVSDKLISNLLKLKADINAKN